MEYLDIVDELGNPTGKTVERTLAHEKGIRHRTSHVWILRKKDNEIQILIQKRSPHKDSYPNCYDISSAGHIPAGSTYEDSAIRELKEELGINVKKEKLHQIGVTFSDSQNVFHGKNFHNVQVSRVYALWYDGDFVLQKEELSSVEWIDLNLCIEKVKNDEFLHCIKLSELQMIKDYLKKKNHRLINGLHHVCLKCTNDKEYKKTIHFYKDILGLNIARTWNDGNAITLNTGNGLIEIFNNEKEQLKQGTIRHFAFAVDNVDKCVEIIRKEGYLITIEPKDVVLDNLPARVAFCLGPVGEEIEFFQDINK